MHKEVLGIISNIIGNINPSNEDDLIEDMGFDSIQMLELIVEVEKYFKISIKDEDFDIENFATINSIIVLVKKYNAQN